MKSSLACDRLPLFAKCLLLGASALACALQANAGLVVTPGSIANDYSGPIDLMITGLDSNGQAVLIEEYFDADHGGTINAGDIFIRQFRVTDGGVASIAGQRNLNIPGDEDGAADKQIHTRLLLTRSTSPEKIDGSHIFRVSPGSGSGFTPFTATLSVTQKDYSGSGISGSAGQAGR